jgi:ABC-type multidrug transport system ATPase subunit
MAEIIRVNDLSKNFKQVTALSRVSFEVRTNEAVALWGSNGAGKTTLLKCLLGILTCEGHIEVMGLDSRHRGNEVRKNVGYIPQEIRLHPDQSVWETACFYAELRSATRSRADTLLRQWGLEDAKKKMVQNLSGGMKQKLALVIALLSEPPILFLDEPTSNLDAQSRTEFSEALERLKSAGKTMIFCSHRLSEVRKIADRVLCLENGVKRSEMKPMELVTS